MQAPAAPLPSRRALIGELNVYAAPSTARGLALAVGDVTLYLAAILGVLFLGPWWAKFGASVFAGMTLARMFSLAHNAAHENVVQGRRLNRLLATMLFLPFFYNYRLWVYEHHTLHHPGPNDAKPDAYRPFSKEEFDRLPAYRRVLERVYRSPNVIGWGLYYLLQRHWSTKIYPPADLPARLRPAAWSNTALLAIYAAVLVAALAAAPRYAVGLDAGGALLLGLVVPFLVFEIHDGFALYAQHTDPAIPWFKGLVDRDLEGRPELLSVHLVVPRWMGWFYHDTFSHSVHHLHPQIPCYRVHAAQLHFDRRLGEAAIVRPLGWRWLRDTTRCCKLYDWDRHQWLAFDGTPTTPVLEVARSDAAPR
ncbi:MAG: fatty acid desaturase [Casimicrobiaceae bacterium]